MYIETSSPRSHGDSAELEFSVSSTDIGKLSCLSFYYHMYGDTMSTVETTLYLINQAIKEMLGSKRRLP